MTGIVWAALAAGAAALGFAAYTVWRTRRKLAEMAQAVADIRAGNGNRRILADEHEPAAPLVFAVNEIVLGYEARIAALQKAEEANRQLMTSLSHDVRTPLTTLIGYLDAAHRGVLAGADRDASLETARRKAHELKDYIDALFDWFQLHSREAALRCEPVEAAELTREILADWVPLFEEQGLAYHIDIPDGPLTARLDPDAYRRILNNLLQNVLAHANAARVSVTLARQGAALALHVADDGAGIPPADLPAAPAWGWPSCRNLPGRWAAQFRCRASPRRARTSPCSFRWKNEPNPAGPCLRRDFLQECKVPARQASS